MNVGGIPVMVTAQINHCNSPIDVTFRITSIDPNDVASEKRNENSSEFSANPQVQQFFRGLPTQNTNKAASITTEKNSFEPNIDWKYTFVTTNQPESREIPGFYTSNNRDTRVYDKRVLFHMTAEDKNYSLREIKPKAKNHSNVIHYSTYHDDYYRQSTYIHVKAQFLLDGQTDNQLTFLDDDSGLVHISNFSGCVGRNYDTEINYIVIGTYNILEKKTCLDKIILHRFTNPSIQYCHIDLHYRCNRCYCNIWLLKPSGIVYLSRSSK